MKLHHLTQGTAEWSAHRAAHWNASDAPAMLGISPYKTRAQLLREYATGVAPEVDAATQRRFDDGHRFEMLARPIAERICGEELYPCTGSGGRYSASFDGLTLLGDTAFEHKTLNDQLRAALEQVAAHDCGSYLPEHYRVQMEHQCLVSGATRVLFMASKWDAGELIEERHCWYYPDPELRARIVAGWEQFERDLASYQPEASVGTAPVGRAPTSLPALHIDLVGQVKASNLQAFEESAIEVFRSIRTDLATDQDFADAEQTVKWCADIEDRLDAAKSHALSQTQSIDELFRAIDAIKAEARSKRLELEKLVTSRKNSIRSDLVAAGVRAVRDHYAEINATLGENAIREPEGLAGEIGSAIKGKRSLASMKDAVDDAVAAEKIAANRDADRVRANLAAYTQAADGYFFLFPDAIALCAEKSAEDLRNLIAARIAAHKLDEDARAAQQQQPVVEQVEQPADRRPVAAGPISTTASAARIKLGDINARIAPLTITADGLAQLGFASLGTERAAKLYRESDFPAICSKLVSVIQNAAAERRVAA